jgi:hypothetical protein
MPMRIANRSDVTTKIENRIFIRINQSKMKDFINVHRFRVKGFGVQSSGILSL